MADLVEEALSSPSLSVYEATPINSNDLMTSEGGASASSSSKSSLSFGITEAGKIS